MPSCEVCGAASAREISGKSARLVWLKRSYPSAPEGRKPALAERIMDLIQQDERWRCAECTVCGCCGVRTGCLVDCAICGAPACCDCSLPALQVDEKGKIIDGSDEGNVLCSRCNPPSGGTNAGLGRPTPARPLALV